MKHFSVILLLFVFCQLFGQKKQCFCDKNTLMNGSTISCETIKLKNNSKLYWQYNCDRIWLTLENTEGNKVTVDEVDIDLYNYTHRLGFHLIKEYENTLLFRSGCSASGPCSYILIDKNNGEKIDEYGQLICIDTDSLWSEVSRKYEFDFIVYLSQDSDDLIIYFIDTKQTIKIPFKEKFTAIVPEQQFDKMSLDNSILTLFYSTEEDPQKTLKINLAPKNAFGDEKF
ncbi:hypothetical protein [Flavobacterium sp. Arc2]|uniref:hypothetical protein n=1 Tax=Flavobacterium sp. Arc2 TaxID=3046685 RepID=UPI00352D5DD3